MKKNPFRSFYRMTAFILILCLGLSLLSCLFVSRRQSADAEESVNRVVVAAVKGIIAESFVRPIAVSETMANDFAFLKQIENNGGANDEAAELAIAEYLESIRMGFGYSKVFAVCDASKVYYTYNGISTLIDPEQEASDRWYSDFKDSGKEMALDVDTDEAANWSLSVFINVALYDDDRNFIGTCGVAVEMEDLQRLLEKYERIYHIKIDLINKDGLIQVDTDGARIERDTITVDGLTDFADGEIYYERKDDGDRAITYMDELGWYLVVTDTDGISVAFTEYIVPCLIVFVIGAAVIVVLYVTGMFRHKKHTEEAALEKTETKEEINT